MRSSLCRLFLVLGMGALTALAQEEKPRGAQTSSRQPSEAAVVRKLSELQFHQGHGLTCLAGAHETGDSKLGAAVSLVKWDPGCVIPWHWHTPNENVLVVEGVLQQEWRDRESATAKHDDFIHIPSHQVNQAKCISETPCVILLYSDGPWDIHFVDASGNEIPVGKAVAAETPSPQSPQSKPDAKVEEEIARIDDERRNAYVQNDATTLDRILADDVTAVAGIGTEDDKASILADVRSHDLTYKKLTYDHRKIRIYGDTAVVTSHAEVVANYKGKDLSGKLLVTRVYAKQQGNWKLVAIQTTRSPQDVSAISNSQDEAELRDATAELISLRLLINLGKQ